MVDALIHARIAGIAEAAVSRIASVVEVQPDQSQHDPDREEQRADQSGNTEPRRTVTEEKLAHVLPS